MKEHVLLASILIMTAGSAQAADWPDSVVICDAFSTCNGCGPMTISVTTGDPPEYHSAAVQSGSSAKQVCDAVAVLAASSGLTTTRVSDPKLLVHGKLSNIGGLTLKTFVAPPTCTKADTFAAADSVLGKEFSPPRRRRVLDAVDLTWATPDNWNGLTLLGRVNDHRVAIMGKWNDCLLSYKEMPINVYFETLRE